MNDGGLLSLRWKTCGAHVSPPPSCHVDPGEGDGGAGRSLPHTHGVPPVTGHLGGGQHLSGDVLRGGKGEGERVVAIRWRLAGGGGGAGGGGSSGGIVEYN